jgi:hypothetical protein
MLRRVVLGLGILMVGGAIGLYLAHDITGSYWMLGFYGAVLLVTTLIERSGYRPTVNRMQPGWRVTDERFIDPTTGKLMEVRYNDQTGERDYVEIPSIQR